jgi:hypothetical protein
MIRDALLKLQGEITAADKHDEVSKGIGAFLIDHLHGNHEDAHKFMTEGKSLSGCVKAMADEASKMKKIGNMVRITDAQGFAMALKYFGVKVIDATPPPVLVAGLDISIEDLL